MEGQREGLQRRDNVKSRRLQRRRQCRRAGRAQAQLYGRCR